MVKYRIVLAGDDQVVGKVVNSATIAWMMYQFLKPKHEKSIELYRGERRIEPSELESDYSREMEALKLHR